MGKAILVGRHCWDHGLKLMASDKGTITLPTVPPGTLQAAPPFNATTEEYHAEGDEFQREPIVEGRPA